MSPRPTAPQVRNLQPPVIRGTGPNGAPQRNAPGVPPKFNPRVSPSTSNPANPGVRGGTQRPTGPGNGPTTRGVIGSRQSQAAAARGAAPTSQPQQPGVRAAKMKSGGDQLNRGVIRGAKQQSSSPARQTADKYGARPARGGVLRSKDEDGVESTYEEQVFTVDQQVVPGVIRGYKDTSKPSSGRGGNNKPVFDDDDDW